MLAVIERLSMYLSEEDVKQILSIIGRRFEQAEVVIEVMNPWVVKTVQYQGKAIWREKIDKG